MSAKPKELPQAKIIAVAPKAAAPAQQEMKANVQIQSSTSIAQKDVNLNVPVANNGISSSSV